MRLCSRYTSREADWALPHLSFSSRRRCLVAMRRCSALELVSGSDPVIATSSGRATAGSASPQISSPAWEEEMLPLVWLAVSPVVVKFTSFFSSSSVSFVCAAPRPGAPPSADGVEGTHTAQTAAVHPPVLLMIPLVGLTVSESTPRFHWKRPSFFCSARRALWTSSGRRWIRLRSFRGRLYL